LQERVAVAGSVKVLQAATGKQSTIASMYEENRKY
jgi:hypothetical protein